MQGCGQQTSYTPRLFSWAQIHSLPCFPERCKGQSWVQSPPPTLRCCSILHTLFPCSRGLQDKPSGRGAVVSSGNIHVPQCRFCGKWLGSLLQPSSLQGLQEFRAPLESCLGQQGKAALPCAQSTFSPLPLTLQLTGLSSTPLWSILTLLTLATPAASLLPSPESWAAATP